MKTIQFDDKAYRKIMKEFEENIENQVFHEELYNFYMNKFEEVTDLIDKPYIDIGKELGVVDWSKVAVDTPVIVWDNDTKKQNNRHFAKYEHGFVWTYAKGKHRGLQVITIL